MAIGVIGALILGGAGLNAFGALRASQAKQEALEIQAQTAARNVNLINFRIGQSKVAGREAEATTLRNIKILQGEQRAGLSRGNIDLSFGTPMDILNDTQEIGDFDLATIKRNTANRVFDLEIARRNAQDDQNLLSGAADDVDPGFAFASTLLTGVTGFAANKQRQRNFNRSQATLNSLLSTT